MANKNDKMILDLKKEIEKKKKLIKDQKFNPITNCSLELDNVRYNLHVIPKETLLLLIGKLRSMEMGLQSVLPEEELKVSGFYVKEWVIDIQSKFSIANIAAEKERLKTLENKLHNLLSTDTKVGLEIEDLKKEIG